MLFIRFILFFFLIFSDVFASKNNPVAIILDTDIGPDYDDVGAMSVLHALADQNEVEILATIASNNYEGIAGVLNVINIYFNRPSIPIAVPKKESVNIRDPQHWSDSLLKNYHHVIHSNKEVPDAVDLYRQILSRQKNHSVTIVTIGFLTNLRHLLLSGPDQYSDLSGVELVKKKVKLVVSMAGSFPKGKEYNIGKDLRASKEVLSKWPTFILLSGYEIGEKIKTGLPLIHSNIQNNPIKDVYRISIPKDPGDSGGRMSWDQTAVLIAVKGFKPWYKLKLGRIIINDNGTNSWSKEGKTQAYIVENKNYKVVQSIIDELMMHQPVKRNQMD